MDLFLFFIIFSSDFVVGDGQRDHLGVGSSTPLEQTEMSVGLSNLIGATTFLNLFESVLSSVHSDSL